MRDGWLPEKQQDLEGRGEEGRQRRAQYGQLCGIGGCDVFGFLPGNGLMSGCPYIRMSLVIVRPMP